MTGQLTGEAVAAATYRSAAGGELVLPDIAEPAITASAGAPASWEAIRSAGGVLLRLAENPYWVVTSFAEAEQVLRDTAAFSSSSGMLLTGAGASASPSTAAVAGTMLIVTDGPRHRELRGAFGGAFTPRYVGALAETAYGHATRLLQQACEQPTVDFVAAVAGELPAQLLCDTLGIAAEDRAEVVLMTRAAFGDAPAGSGYSQEQANAELFAFCADFVEDRRHRPRDDFGSFLANAEIKGRPVSEDEAVLNLHGIVSGGMETSRHAVTMAACSWAEHPEAWQGLRTEPDLSLATEEVLRIASPANHVMRRAVREVEVGDAVIGPGEFVTVWLGAANRDGAAFPGPDELRLDRRGAKHLAFGGGSHSCLGAFLARLEIREMLRAMLGTVARIETAGPVEWLQSNVVRGYVSAPMALTAS
jgi:cytochrome P450